VANCFTSKTPYLVQHSWLYVLFWLSYGQFCVKIPTFSLPWQQGLSDVYFNNTIKLLDYENPLFGAGFVALSLALAAF